MSVPTTESRSLGDADQLADNYVNPYYLEDRKRRVAVARIDGRLYAFDDLCSCADEGCRCRQGC